MPSASDSNTDPGDGRVDSVRRTLSQLSQPALRYLVPAALRDDPQLRVQAGRTVAFGLAMLFWTPVFAPIYYLLGSPRGGLMIACVAVAIILSLSLLRWTRNVELVGNLLAASVFCVLIGLAMISGGIDAASVMWLPAVVIIALVLGGTRAGIAWALASCLACLVLVSLPTTGVDLPNDIGADKRWVLDFAATCGIVLCAFSLTFLFKVSESITRQALEVARDQSDQANRAKSTFLANMSHEIRTPLNAVLGMAELMQDTPLSRQQQEYLEIVQDSGKALLALVDDILDFSRIEAGKLVLACQRFDIHQSLLRTLKALAVPAHKQGLELVCHIEPSVPRYVVGDSGRLRQIVMNLVGNAIKFTERGEVVLRVQVEDQLSDTARLHFSVQDSGIGIPKDRQAAIFYLFEQADMSTTRRFGGVGLGLAITSHLVQAMGGRVAVTSEVSKGSTFEFTANFGVTSQDAPPRPAALDGKRVLVVEDHPIGGKVLEEMLSGWGMQTQVATKPSQALQLVTNAQSSGAPFGFILVDCLLGNNRGCDLVVRIQQTTDWEGRMLMMLTSDRLPESLARCEQIGVHDYVVKPIGQWELLEALQPDNEGSRRPKTPSCQEADSAIPSPKLHVLLAEDSLVNQKLAAALIKKLGHEVVVANNGNEALAAWESQPFDLILMDIQMPEMDGLEATRVIRQREQQRGTHVPIVAVTAHVLPEDREQCSSAGMDQYLGKPINGKSLAAVIEEVIKTSTTRVQ